MKQARPIFTWLIVAATLACVFAPLFQHDTRGGYEMQKFGRLPVLLNGRIKPLDTVARNSLLIIHGQQTLRTEQGTLTAIDWLADLDPPERSVTAASLVCRSRSRAERYCSAAKNPCVARCR